MIFGFGVGEVARGGVPVDLAESDRASRIARGPSSTGRALPM